MFNPKKSNFSDDSVQTEAFSLLKTLQRQPRFVAKFLQFLAVVAVYVAIAEPVENGQFNLVYKPVKQPVFHRHIAQNQPAIFPQTTPHAL